MKLSEYIDMRCIIEEYSRMKKRDYISRPDSQIFIKEIEKRKSEWAREIVDKMDCKISDYWPWSDGWTNDQSVSDKCWNYCSKRQLESYDRNFTLITYDI
jgi:hypothetical protein